MKKRETRGGPRKGAGLKPGTYKNAQKPPEERHSDKRQVSYTQTQGERVDAAMEKVGVKKHTDFSRYAVLKYCDEILQGDV